MEKNNWSTGDTEQEQTSSIHCFIRGVTTLPEVCLTHYKSKMKKGRRGGRKKGERAERKEKDTVQGHMEEMCSKVGPQMEGLGQHQALQQLAAKF